MFFFCLFFCVFVWLLACFCFPLWPCLECFLTLNEIFFSVCFLLHQCKQHTYLNRGGHVFKWVCWFVCRLSAGLWPNLHEGCSTGQGTTHSFLWGDQLHGTNTLIIFNFQAMSWIFGLWFSEQDRSWRWEHKTEARPQSIKKFLFLIFSQSCSRWHNDRFDVDSVRMHIRHLRHKRKRQRPSSYSAQCHWPGATSWP